MSLMIFIPSVSSSGETSELTAYCVEEAAREMDIPVKLLWGILAVECGPVGSATPNENGTFDYGPMQINTLWLPEVQKKFNATETELRNNACLNVRVGAWILRQEIDRDPTWAGVAAYHSKTPEFAHRYLILLKNRLKNLDVERLMAKINKVKPKESGTLSKNATAQSSAKAVSKENKPDALHARTSMPPNSLTASVTVRRDPDLNAAGKPDTDNTVQPSPTDGDKNLPAPLNIACVEKAAKDMNVSLSVLLGILATENGAVGQITKRPDGTFVYGPMQISSNWLPRIQEHLDINKESLISDSCLNVRAGAWILRQHIEKNPTWAGVAAYHGAAPDKVHYYLAKLLTNIYSIDVSKLLQKINTPSNPL